MNNIAAWSLNPCFSGCWSRTAEVDVTTLPLRVLILVLVDVGLGLGCIAVKGREGLRVLILVLVDVGLGLVDMGAGGVTQLVLILVLVDVGLGHVHARRVPTLSEAS